MTIWHLVALVLAIIFLLFSLTFYLYWSSRNFDCQFNPNPWCWADWRCGGVGSASIGYPAQILYGCGSDAQGNPYPTRDASYCSQTDYPNPPGCQCVPDSTGAVNPATCTFGWSATQMGACATALQNYKDGDPSNIAYNCQTKG